MTFSIVIPAHNGEQYLGIAIESVLNQTRAADEIVVIDDASTDATADIVKSYGNRIKYHFNQKSTGFVDAWNRAIQKISSDYVSILHQDDLLNREYLLRTEKALEQYAKIRHIYTGCHYIDESGNIIKSTPKPHLLEPVLYTGKQYAKKYLNGAVTNQHIHRCPGVITSRDLLLNECTYRKEAGHIADDDFFLRVGTFTDVIGISQPLASYRHHTDSATSKLDSLTLKLAENYVFQVRYYKENITLLDSDDIIKLSRQAVKFINLLLYQSLLYKQKDLTAKAFDLRQEIEEIIPSFIEQNLPGWAQKMWQLTAGTESQNHIATLYVKSLSVLGKARDVIKSYLAKNEFHSI